MSKFWSRRRLLTALAAIPASALPVSLHRAARAQGLITGSVCLVQPQTTEGPFYLDDNLVRRDITEGAPGVPLRLRLQVVEADCTPVAGARIDVWHCDARGVYSGVQGATGTFLRGTQVSDARGVAEFATIYPGWYPGRTPHIHYIVHLGGSRVLTSQLFFPDSVGDAVYGNAAPYTSKGMQDRSNAQDGIARRAGRAAVAAVSGSTAALAADLVVGIA